MGTAAVDLSLLVPVLEGIAEDLNPAFIEMWNGMNLQFSQNFGVDLKEDIFGALGTGIIMAQFHEGDAGISFEHTPMGQQPQLLAFKLRDADRLRLTWTTLQARMFPQGALPPGMEARDYLGQEIVLMKSPSPISPSKEQVIALCITDEYFIISLYSTYPLERALQMLAGDEGGSLWDRPDVEDDMAWTPREAVGLNRQDLAVVFAQVFGSLKNAAELLEESEELAEGAEQLDEQPIPFEALFRSFDFSETPDLEMLRKYLGVQVSVSVAEEDGLYSESRLPHEPQ